MATLKNTTINDTGFLRFPNGTTAQRPGTPTIGMSRYNTTTSSFEGWDGTNWVPLGGGARGATGNFIFFENDTAVTGNYSITTGKNAVTAGPVTVNNGVVITIPNGSAWTIV
jgi:hypothetical protein